jgi:hypothetical protein
MTNLSISQLAGLANCENPNEPDFPLENISGDKSGEKQNIGKWEKNICYFCLIKQRHPFIFSPGQTGEI